MYGLRDATGLLVLSRNNFVVCDLTQPIPFLWLAGILFVCIIHLEPAIANPHDVDAPEITNIF